MFILSNLVISCAYVVNIVLTFLYWMILIRALLSWVSPDPFNPLVQFLVRTTEPLLEPIRRRLPYMAIDLSPLIVFLAILFLKSFLVQTLFDIGFRLRG